jgi:hypothetical protein
VHRWNPKRSLTGTGFLATILVLGFIFSGWWDQGRNNGSIVRASSGSSEAPHPPPPDLNSTIPPDVDIPASFPANMNPIEFFDDYSWKVFVAINWPAVAGKRGVADQNKKIGDKSLAVVWETWKASYELFQPRGAAPSEWSSFDAVSPCSDIPRANGGKKKTLTAFSKLGTILEDFNQAVGENPSGPLVAQNQSYVRYEIRMNQPQYEFIRGDPKKPQTALYLRKNLPAPGGSSLTFPDGSIEIKAAWREIELPKEQKLLERYYHVDTLLLNPQTNKCETKTMGLVGLHIVQKTPSRPQWIWSTFEHVDNVTVGPNAPEGTKPSFNDPAGPQMGDKINVMPDPINAGNPPKPSPDPVQVVRLVLDKQESPTIPPPATAKINALYQAKLKNTVWSNYQLVMTQWPTQPKAGGKGDPFPRRNVANVTMETYLQGNSCINCHFQTTSPTDFVWFINLRAYPPSGKVVEDAARVLNATRPKKMKQ